MFCVAVMFGPPGNSGMLSMAVIFGMSRYSHGFYGYSNCYAGSSGHGFYGCKVWCTRRLGHAFYGNDVGVPGDQAMVSMVVMSVCRGIRPGFP